MNSPTMRLTAADIDRCRTANGGFTRKTLECFGHPWPPQSGWAKKLRGTMVSVDQYEKALAGRTEHVQRANP